MAVVALILFRSSLAMLLPPPFRHLLAFAQSNICHHRQAGDTHQNHQGGLLSRCGGVSLSPRHVLGVGLLSQDKIFKTLGLAGGDKKFDSDSEEEELAALAERKVCCVDFSFLVPCFYSPVSIVRHVVAR